MFKKSTFHRNASASLILVLCCFVTFSQLWAAPNSEKSENRFLFIVDTSSAMKSLAPAGNKAISALLQSEIGGQLHNGDTIGLWTYNSQLHDDFPMQVWSESARDGIACFVQNYLAIQKPEKKSHLEEVLPSMYAAVKASHTLTVILVSDGSGTMKGTLFDKTINDLYRGNRKAYVAKRLPFVTVLGFRDGDAFDFVVNSADQPIRIPQTAEAVKVVAAPVVAAPPAARTNVAPVITPMPLRPVEPKGIEIGSPFLPPPAPVVVPEPPAATAPEVKPVVPATPVVPQTIPSNPPPLAVVTPPVIAPVAVSPEPPVLATRAPSPPPKLVEPAVSVVQPMNKPTVKKASDPSGKTVVPPKLSNRSLLAGGCFMLAVLAGCVGFFMLQSRKPSQRSLISQSLSKGQSKDTDKSGAPRRPEF